MRKRPLRNRSFSWQRLCSGGSAGGYGRCGRLNRVGGQHGHYRGHDGQQQDVRCGWTTMTCRLVPRCDRITVYNRKKNCK